MNRVCFFILLCAISINVSAQYDADGCLDLSIDVAPNDILVFGHTSSLADTIELCDLFNSYQYDGFETMS